MLFAVIFRVCVCGVDRLAPQTENVYSVFCGRAIHVYNTFIMAHECHFTPFHVAWLVFMMCFSVVC